MTGQESPLPRALAPAPAGVVLSLNVQPEMCAVLPPRPPIQMPGAHARITHSMIVGFALSILIPPPGLALCRSRIE